MDTINGDDRYSLLGLTSNFRCAYYIGDICFYTWGLVESGNVKRKCYIHEFKASPVFHARPMFLLKLSFSASLCSHFSREEKKRREQGRYSNAKRQTERRLRKLNDLTDERQPKKKPRNHPSTASRVLKEITWRSNHPSRIYSDERARALSNSAYSTLIT